MTTDIEVQSFVTKFNQFWKCGYQAELQFKCNAGQAFINLQVGLVYANSLQAAAEPPKKHVSPSRFRRRIIREDMRKNIVPSENDVDEVESNVQILIDKVNNTCDSNNESKEVGTCQILSECAVEAQNALVNAEDIPEEGNCSESKLENTDDAIADANEDENYEPNDVLGGYEPFNCSKGKERVRGCCS